MTTARFGTVDATFCIGGPRLLTDFSLETRTSYNMYLPRKSLLSGERPGYQRNTKRSASAQNVPGILYLDLLEFEVERKDDGAVGEGGTELAIGVGGSVCQGAADFGSEAGGRVTELTPETGVWRRGRGHDAFEKTRLELD